MKETEKLAPLLPALSWNCGGSCPHHNVAYGTDVGPNFGIKTMAIYGEKDCVITGRWNSYKKRKSFWAVCCIWPRTKTFSDFKSTPVCTYLNTENDSLTQKPAIDLTGFRSDPFRMFCVPQNEYSLIRSTKGRVGAKIIQCQSRWED